MYHRPLVCLAAIGVSLTLARAAPAHIKLTYPPQRGGPADQNQKVGPCGNNGPKGDVTILEPGSKIVVEWDETVDHPGHFRISFDDDGADFVDPTGYDDFTTDPATLLEGNIPDGGGSSFSQEVTLPDVECENCTLQLIQVMTDKPPWGPGGGNDIYYRCADLVLKAAGGAGAGGAGAAGAGGAGAAGAGGAGADGGGGSGSGSGAGGAGGTGGETATSAGGGGSSADSSDGGGCNLGGRGDGWAAAIVVAALLGARRKARPRAGG